MILIQSVINPASLRRFNTITIEPIQDSEVVFSFANMLYRLHFQFSAIAAKPYSTSFKLYRH
jgi:hypothetical protein